MMEHKMDLWLTHMWLTHLMSIVRHRIPKRGRGKKADVLSAILKK